MLELNCNVSRIDLAVDDFVGFLDFKKMERKLNKGHYRSSKKSFNIIKQQDVNGNICGYTQYIGTRSTGSNGHTYYRGYDKYAEMLSKGKELPEIVTETGVWQRYEIEFTKKKSQSVIEYLVNDGLTLNNIYCSALRDIVEFLVPSSNDSNKSRWKVCSWWNDFLGDVSKMKFGEINKKADLYQLVNWVNKSVVGSIQVISQVADSVGVDFYDLLKSLPDKDVSLKNNLILKDIENLDKDSLKSLILRSFC